MTTELAIRPDQTTFDEKQLAALRALGVQNAPAADVALLFHQAARTGLDPFARQIYLIGRAGKYSIQTGIDGFRVIRDRSGTYRGHTEEWCGPDGKWRDVWLESKPPAAAKVSVHVAGYDVPIVGIARWAEYAQESSPTWKKMPALMLAKCAEALALRKAYPQDLSGIYTADELSEAEQDADGVYVTTTMRNGAPNRDGGHNRKTEARFRDSGGSEPVADATPASRPTPGRSRVQAPAAPGPATGPTRDQADVYADWITRIDDTADLDALIRLHGEAAERGVLDHRNTAGVTIEDAFLARRTWILEQDALPVEDVPDDELLPF